MEDWLQRIADRKWLEMIQALDKKGPDFAFDVFADALKKAAYRPSMEDKRCCKVCRAAKGDRMVGIEYCQDKSCPCHQPMQDTSDDITTSHNNRENELILVKDVKINSMQATSKDESWREEGRKKFPHR